jgi:hypothetical protein
MRLGVTGTRHGITNQQLLRLQDLIISSAATELHHGDCQGADAVAHFTVLNSRAGRLVSGFPRIDLIVHPPDRDAWRAFCQGYDFIRDPLPYLARDDALVNESDLLIAAPRTTVEETRSGTWATVRRARKQYLPIIIVSPDGSWHLDKK